jgi:hypothetical protein
MVEKLDNNKINELCDYLVIKYINENSTSFPVFKPVLVLIEVLLQMLINIFDFKFNSNDYHHYPNIFKIIEVLEMF